MSVPHDGSRAELNDRPSVHLPGGADFLTREARPMNGGSRVRVSGCAECDRLWNLFNAAGIQLLDLEHSLRLAELHNNGERAEDLRATIKDAQRNSDLARQAIAEHETTHHA